MQSEWVHLIHTTRIMAVATPKTACGKLNSVALDPDEMFQARMILLAAA